MQDCRKRVFDNETVELIHPELGFITGTRDVFKFFHMGILILLSFAAKLTTSLYLVPRFKMLPDLIYTQHTKRFSSSNDISEAHIYTTNSNADQCQ